MSVMLHIHGGPRVEVTRPDAASSWRGDATCPVCGLQPVRVRAYVDDTAAPAVQGHDTAHAWCAGRHDAPIGLLVEPYAVGVLLPMGEPTEQPETFRCRIYGGGA